jgi:hypothetical protein
MNLSRLTRKGEIMKTQVTRKALLELSTNKEICHMKFGSEDFMALIHRSDFNEMTQKTLGHIRPKSVDVENLRAVALTKAQTLRYLKVPAQYCTHKEALIIGLNFKFHQERSSAITDKHIKSYLGHATAGCPETEYLATVSLGIIHFNEAMELEGKERKDILKISLAYFLHCLRKGHGNSLVVTKVGLIQGFLGKFDVAIKFLLKAARISVEPFFQFSIISKLYGSLGMEKERVFYERRAGGLSTNYQLKTAA